ncbi:MAG: hypothetical protein HY921_03840 [Elusimicrobia bacterium]|nr:hypothetical protein [Elusimicrobiota bacterium]
MRNITGSVAFLLMITGSAWADGGQARRVQILNRLASYQPLRQPIEFAVSSLRGTSFPGEAREALDVMDAAARLRPAPLIPRTRAAAFGFRVALALLAQPEEVLREVNHLPPGLGELTPVLRGHSDAVERLSRIAAFHGFISEDGIEQMERQGRRFFDAATELEPLAIERGAGGWRRLLPFLAFSYHRGVEEAKMGRSQVLIDFSPVMVDPADTGGVDARPYLAAHGILIQDMTSGTRLVVRDARSYYDGDAVQGVMGSNVMTQQGSNEPVSFVMEFLDAGLRGLSASMPLFFGDPGGITLPSLAVKIFDRAGDEIYSFSRNGSGSYDRVIRPEGFALARPGIKWARFFSSNLGTAFNAALFDRFLLDY